MADDIDIEEHDVMDNPAVKKVFPDLSIVKNEILDYGAEEANADTTPAGVKKTNSVEMPDSTTDIPNTQLSITKVENSVLVSSTRHDSTDIDRKPKIIPINVLKDDTLIQDVRNQPQILDSSRFYGNKIIIGSKPAKLNTEHEDPTMNAKEMEKCLSAKIIVKNCYRSLRHSRSFCLKCKILFPSRKNCTEHRYLEHGDGRFNNDTDSPVSVNTSDVTGNEAFAFKCDMCLAVIGQFHNFSAHYRKFHGSNPTRERNAYKVRKNFGKIEEIEQKLEKLREKAKVNSVQSVKEAVLEKINKNVVEESVNKYITGKDVVLPKKEIKVETSDNLCGHCNKPFETKEDLINHLYDILQPKKFECQRCNEKFDKKENLESHSCEVGTINNEDNESFDNDNEYDSLVESRQSMSEEESVLESDSDHGNMKEKLFYKCHVCASYSTTKFAFDQHYKTYHPNSINYIKYVKNLFSSTCKFCELQFNSQRGYNVHVAKSHLPSREEGSTKLYCQYCKEAFADNLTVIQHVNFAHKKKVPNTYKSNKSSTMLLMKSPPIPKYYLFKCQYCDIHYLTYTQAANHVPMCNKNYDGTFKCSDCDKVLRKNYSDVHRKQHIFTDDFTVLKVGEDKGLGRKALCNCPKCGVHFTDIKFWKHYPNCGENVPNSIYCRRCDILIDATSHSVHRKVHATNEDIHLIEFQVINEESMLDEPTTSKRKIEDLPKPVPKKPKVEAVEVQEAPKAVIDIEKPQIRFKFIYCDHCECFSPYDNKDEKTHHFRKFCLYFDKKYRSCCLFCALTFNRRDKSSDHHKVLHDNFQNLTISNYDFYSLDDKQINPPMPIFPRCKKCGVFYKGKQGPHNCKDTNNFTCLDCNLIFSQIAYKLHRDFHDYIQDHPDLETVQTNKDTDTKIVTVQKSSQELYQCKLCEVLVSKDHVEAHKDSKLDCRKNKNSYKKCGKCDITLGDSDIYEHLELHKSDPSFDKNSLKINVFHKVFNNSDSDEDNYVEEKNKTVFYVYKCRQCKLCVHTLKASDKHQCHFKATQVCDICQLKFARNSLACHHKYHQAMKNMNRQNIKIIKFGVELTIDSKRNVKSVVSETANNLSDVNKIETEEIVINVPMKEIVENDNTIKEKIDIYQCVDCKLLYHNESIKSTHVCMKRIPYRCFTCGYSFEKTEFDKHVQYHSSNSKFNKTFLKLHSFEVKTEQAETATVNKEIERQDVDDINGETIYKCSCGLHFIDEDEGHKHKSICWSKIRAAKQNCTKCDLVFTPNVLFAHLLKHHGEKNKEFKYKIVDLPEKSKEKETLYKCKKCKAHFLEKEDISKHFNLCYSSRDVNRKDCLLCGLMFESRLISSHTLLHHTKANMAAKEFNIIELWKDDLSDNETDETNWQKCDSCEIHFVSKQSYYEHVLVDNHEVKGSTAMCDECKCAFLEKDLVEHKKIIHVKTKVECKEPKNRFEKYTITETLVEKLNSNDKYSKEIFKCRDCNIYFMLENSVIKHIQSFHIVLKNTKTCNVCGFVFSISSLARHNYIHHEKLNLQPNEIIVKEYPLLEDAEKKPKQPCVLSDETLNKISLTKYSKKIYQCAQCNINFLTKCALESHILVQNHKFSAETSNCEFCGLRFIDRSLARHKYIHHTKMGCKLEDFDFILKVEAVKRKKAAPEDEVKPILYKCKECDNHFMTQDRCYRHVAYGHEAIPKANIIPCEFCSLKFLKPSLLSHKQLHHIKRNYTLKDIMIEEYEPMDLSKPFDKKNIKPVTYMANERIHNDACEINSIDSGDESTFKTEEKEEEFDFDFLKDEDGDESKLKDKSLEDKNSKLDEPKSDLNDGGTNDVSFKHTNLDSQ